MHVRKPSCFSPSAYDPGAPLRAPLSRRSTAECTAEMAAIMAEILHANGNGTVTKDDLHRAGFTDGEIDRCHADAVVALRSRVAPRQIQRAA